MSNDILQVFDTLVPVEVISIGEQGPAGPQGPQGISAGAVQRIATTALGGNRLVVSVNNIVVYADNTNPAHSGRLLGLTNAAAVSGSLVEIVTSGDVEEPSWAFTPDQPVYLGTNGLLTQVPPVASSAAFLQVVGFAVTATRLFLNPLTPITLSE